ncbi:DUF3472 domain-containing protein [Edaphobacter acidisoli]|nr:DUF3472 domain-containing protein [Edaphobacter acidisoli]
MNLYPRRWSSMLALCLLVTIVSFAAGQTPSLDVPGFTAYSEPNPEALHISENSPLTGWSDPATTVAWYGQIRSTGKLSISIRLQVPEGSKSKIHLTVGGHNVATKSVKGTSSPAIVSFGSIHIDKTGPYKFALTGIKKSGTVFADIQALDLAGPAAEDALFNLTPQRGAPSVHLHYPAPAGAQVEWFYNEVTVKTDPIWSYYEACGFARGYFGIQVNSPTERRIIFSVWDAGNEHTDRGKVATDNRVQLLAKGPDVVAGSFGNEGTGGHSHLVYPWKTGETYRFLLHAKPDGATTIYTAYFYFPEKHGWGMIARFRAPKDGNYLSHLYSFNEDFEGANGQLQRLAEFGNQWIRTTDGHWIELTKARFTHTAVGAYKDRIDRGAGVTGDRFYLTNGGFKPETFQYNDELTRPSSGKMPDITLPQD